MPEDIGSWLIIDTATTTSSTAPGAGTSTVDPAATVTRAGERGVRIVRVFGEIDLATRTAFAAGLERVLSEDPRRIVVDATAMAFCSAGGLGLLMSTVARGAERGTDVAVVGFSPVLRRLCAQFWPGPQPLPYLRVTDAVDDAAGDVAAPHRPATSLAVTA